MSRGSTYSAESDLPPRIGPSPRFQLAVVPPPSATTSPSAWRSCWALLVDRPKETHAELLAEILRSEHPPVVLMAHTADPAYLPALRRQMAGANKHTRTFLAACARALGARPERTVRISSKHKGDFRPASAWPNTDSSRSGSSLSHGDGITLVLLTGSLKMPDGTPVKSPRLFRINGSMLLGQTRNDEVAIKFIPATGRFQFLTTVFAARTPEPGEEPGPYQTGSALVRVEAEGAEPLEVRFFDEMPDVEITLERAVETK